MVTSLAALAVSDAEIRAGMILAHLMAARMRGVRQSGSPYGCGMTIAKGRSFPSCFG
jgi:hypothetical protein